MWISQYSVDDEDTPEKPKTTRAKFYNNIYFFKPNPEIRGYTMINDQELTVMGSIPNSMVSAAYSVGALKANTEFYKVIEADARARASKLRKSFEGMLD